MENPVPVQASEESIQPPNNKKYLGVSIFAGVLYGLPALLIGFVIFFVLIILLLDAATINFPQFNETVSVNVQILMVFALSTLMGIIMGSIAGGITGRTTYRRLKADGSIRPVGYSMLSCAGIGVLGLFIFPVICFSSYYLLSFLPDKGAYIIGFLTGGTESVLAAIFIVCVPSISVFLAYITAIIFGGVVYRILSKKRREEIHAG